MNILVRITQRWSKLPREFVGSLNPEVSLQDLSGHHPERNRHKPMKGCSLKSWKSNRAKVSKGAAASRRF